MGSRLNKNDSGTGLSRFFILTQLGIILCGIVPLLIVIVTPQPVATGWGGFAVIVISGFRYAIITSGGERRLVEVVFWLFSYVFFGLAQTVQLRTGINPSTTPGLDRDYNNEAAWMILVGIGAFLLGHAASSMRRTQSTASGVVTASDEARVRTVNRSCAYALAGMALVVDGYYILNVGLVALFGSRDGLNLRASVLWPDPTLRVLVSAGAAMVPLISFVALVQLWRDSAGERRAGTTLLIVAVSITLLLAVNPISSPRYVFGTVALGMLTAVGLFATRRRFQLTAVGALLAMVLAFPFGDVFRRETVAEPPAVDPLIALTTGDYDAFAQVNNTALYVDRSGTTMGRQALGVVLFWVPRSIWTTKPTDTGILLANSRGYQFTNLSAPLPAELFINGGWSLLIAGMFLGGAFVQRWDDRLISVFARGARAPSVFSCAAPFYLLIVLRGSLLQAAAYLAVIGGSAVFVTWTSRPSSLTRNASPPGKR